MLKAERFEELFEYGDEASITRQYRQHRNRHHPDRGGSDEDFIKVQKFYEEALNNVRNNMPWQTATAVIWNTATKSFSLNVLRKRPFSLGDIYESNAKILYTYHKGNEYLAERALKAYSWVEKDLGPSETLRTTNRGVFPNVDREKSSCKAPAAILLKKENHVLPLRLILDKHGPFEQVHALWVIGRMMHILTYLSYAKIMHGALSVDNFYVSTKEHSLHLYGGWEYAHKIGDKLEYLPSESVKLCSSGMLKNKIAESSLDWECARYAISEVMGHKSPAELRMDKKFNNRLSSFLSLPFSAKSAFDLYLNWEKLRDSFGTRRFVEFK